jgi:uncharacterized protein YodC (DUF2158 family)
MEKGNTVKLKSGGPIMTIDGFEIRGININKSRLICKWFDGPNVINHTFDKEALILVELPNESSVKATNDSK